MPIWLGLLLSGVWVAVIWAVCEHPLPGPPELPRFSAEEERRRAERKVEEAIRMVQEDPDAAWLLEAALARVGVQVKTQ